MSQAILVVDDEKSIREMLEILLSREGYQVATAGSGPEALTLFKKKPFSLVLTDIRMQPMDGLTLLKEIKAINRQTEVIIISAFASQETAIEAMNEGAYDFFPKPFNNQELKQVVRDALIRAEGKTDSTEEGTAFLSSSQRPMVGQSLQMKKVYELILKAAQVVSTVLITGESGTGKELVARSIHENSPRKDQPFIPISCAGIPETLIESELFGYSKGAFTGAQTHKMGLVETAHKGTLFLDEIGELPQTLQVKILRLLQEKTFLPLGERQERSADIRVICATNRDLEQEVMEKHFREDLFYRINVITIQMPPLRDRPEDIPLLAQFFLEKYSRNLDKEIRRISSYALKILSEYHFPGNVRELENIIERSVAMERSTIILPESLALAQYKGLSFSGKTASANVLPAEGLDLDQAMDSLEKDMILQALQKTQGNKQRAAALLKINLRSLRYRMLKHGMETE
ncbi:MAG TPA: sigma-54 dependent transcriptional regulator [Thermodesulfobacteriota bacterium]|nr:sigma-54 dependent transcriptional regulator [Thermodesulfobacteriota bacterium]